MEGSRYVVLYLVCGQIQLVEAGVGRRQPVSGPVISVDLELLGSVHPLQSSESLKINAQCYIVSVRTIRPLQGEGSA